MVSKKKADFHTKLIDHVYNNIPAFTDVFTEETFYMTAVIFVLCTLVLAFILSRFVTIKAVD